MLERGRGTIIILSSHTLLFFRGGGVVVEKKTATFLTILQIYETTLNHMAFMFNRRKVGPFNFCPLPHKQ